ncbi:MAG: hypothetical protein OES57_15715, partial [Acidimicrobiia bacterium]|nr:hypothetical protein [Acidimicrobiia bacterium]
MISTASSCSADRSSMFTYALVHASGGLPPRVRRHLEDVDRAHLFDELLSFPVRERLLWFDASGSVAVVGWWSGLDELGAGRPWCERDGSLTAFTGYVWPRRRGWRWTESWAQQLGDELDGDAVRADDLGLSGVFSAVTIDDAGDGLLVGDPLGFSLVYRGVAQGITVYGNRSAVCAQILAGPDQSPRRSAANACWMAFAGDYVDDVTGFDDVEVVPIGTRVEVTSTAVVEVPTASPATAFEPGELSVDEAVELIGDELTAELELVAAIPASCRVADLTGGKDSRLILSGLLRAGRTDDFTFYTVGGPTTPDVMVSDRLVERYGLVRSKPPRAEIGSRDRWLPLGA